VASSPSQRVLVTGGSGFVGSRVLRALVIAYPNHEVVCLSRRPPLEISNRVRHLAFDFASRDAIPDIEVDVIVHIAGETRDEALMERVNVEGTRALLDHARQKRVKRFILMSSVGVYGATPDSGTITEASPHRPKNLYERTKSTSESLTRTLCESGGVAYTILQPSNVIGTGPGGPYPLLGFIRSVARRRLVRIQGRTGVLNYVAVSDVARAAVGALNGDATGTFILNSALSADDAVAIIGNALGVAKGMRTVPYAVGYVAGAAADVATMLTGVRLPLSRARIRELTNTTIYDASRSRLLFGGDYPCGIRRALADLAGEYRAMDLV
jgi:nucleoside-diphosphate-sugar epimerase